MPSPAQDTEIASSHRFVLTIGTEIIGAFTECTLPTLEFETEEVKEGGQNQYVHTLVSRRKSGRLVLKRGLVKSSILLGWYQDVLQTHNLAASKMKKSRQEVSVVLFDSMQNIVEWWFFGAAVPVKWTGPTLKADQAAAAIETLELVVHDYERVTR